MLLFGNTGESGVHARDFGVCCSLQFSGKAISCFRAWRAERTALEIQATHCKSRTVHAACTRAPYMHFDHEQC